MGFMKNELEKKRQKNHRKRQWRCVDYCCWMIGYVCTAWWLLSFLCHCLTGFDAPESPGVRLNREGVTALHPVVLVPGIVTGGLQLWEGRPCAEDLFRKPLWGGSFAQILKRPLCWLEHLSLHNETGLDPPGIRVRAVPGLAADNFASGYLVWEVLIENLARIGYEGRSLYMAAYDWRLSFQNTEVCRTWDSIISLMLKGGETIWGDLDWGPKEWSNCDQVKRGYMKHFASDNTYNCSDMQKGLHVKEPMKYGRMISFGKAVSQLLSSVLNILDSEEISLKSNSAIFNLSCEDARAEYDEMSRESIQKAARKRAYTGRTDSDLLNFVAPKMMKRAEAHFSHGIAENLDDPKYTHYKYWSNPLETKLPDAPHMEMYCLYGVGIATERSYVYKIPFQLDSSADGEEGSKLQNGVHFVDGDESVTVVSSAFMCAKGWRGRTRFNPSGMATYVREYQHKQPGSVLEGRGLDSGARVNIMGNVALIEDVLRVAAGATGADIGGDRISSDIMRMSERINIRL